MKRIKRYLQSSPYGQLSIFVLFTSSILYLLYQTARHLPLVLTSFWSFLVGLFAALSPLIIGFIIAYLLSPLVNRISEKMPRCLAILATFLAIFLAVFLLFYSLTLLLFGQVAFYGPEEMIRQLISYFNEYEQTISQVLTRFPSSLLSDGLENTINQFISRFADKIDAAAAVDFAKNIGGHILNFVLGIVVSFYLLNDRDFFLRLWRKTLHMLLPLKQSAWVKEFLSDVNGVVSRFLRGQLLDGLIVAVLSCIGLSLIKLQFAVFIGIFAGVSNIIPYFGPVIGMIPAAIVGISTGGLEKALMSVLVLFLIQQLDSTIISPKVVGTSTGLHPVFVLLSVAVGGYYFGILGMLLAVPTTAIVKLFLIRLLYNLD